MPRYSVLLPTRNGAALLEGCLRSVLDQDYEDFELVVSDNASEDETPEILARYASDPRIRLLRQERALGVTDNWNAALSASSGERITLLGDDDALLPGYFQRADALVERHGDPDVLLYNGCAFAFPGFAGSKVSSYADPFFEIKPPVPSDGELSAALRQRIIAAPVPLRLPDPAQHADRAGRAAGDCRAA